MSNVSSLPCDVTQLRLISAALALQQATATAASMTPIPSTGRFMVIGTPAEVARLLEIAPASARPNDADLLQALQNAARLLRAAGFAMNGTCSSKIVEAINKHASAQPVAAAPAGWKLVPLEPTDKMTYIGQDLRYVSVNSIGEIYRQMVAAAPVAPVAQATMACTVPPPGWYCTRERGHDGPCAAHPAAGDHDHSEGGHHD